MKIKKINNKKNNINPLQYLNSIYKSYKLHFSNSNINIKKSSLSPLNKKTNKINNKLRLSDRGIFSNYLRQVRLFKKIKNRVNKKINVISKKTKNKKNASLRKKVADLIKSSSVYRKFAKNIKKPVALVKQIKPRKIKPILPWIVQGREQQLKLEHTLMLLLFRLKNTQIKKNNKIAILTPQDSKLIKQYRKKAKFSKFGRYGTHAKSRIKLNKLKKSKAKFVKPLKKKIKRQQIYLQNKKLSIINNGDNFISYKYIYMLIVIWYILNNVFFIGERKTFEREIWLDYFLKNMWIQQACSTTTNWYLNYGTIISLKAIPQAITLYNPTINMVDYQSKPLKNHDRLFIGISNKKKSVNIKQLFKSKRKSKIRHFFKISPKLKNSKKTIKFFFNKKTKKKVKMQKRLSAQEWLLMSKFTRKKYQDKFSTVFSQWKNVKQIQRYINKQSQVWHQPYFITHPYYYTNRYNTFIYQMAQE